jgi:GH24 family phage-related lysozyme (muramidase)
MRIKNLSGKTMGIGPLTLLPGAVETVPKEFESNPLIPYFVKIGRVEIVSGKAAQVSVSESESNVAKVRKMKRAELESAASEHGIAVEETDTVVKLKEKLITCYRQQE